MSKYHAIKTEVDGIVFASRAESRRYRELALLEQAGQIKTLGIQPRFKCVVNGVLVCTYVGDFDYWENGEYIVEDVKGFLTPVFKLKRKLVKALHGITIR
jgi:hypothetical protein